MTEPVIPDPELPPADVEVDAPAPDYRRLLGRTLPGPTGRTFRRRDAEPLPTGAQLLYRATGRILG